MSAKITKFPTEATENTVQGTLDWASNQDFEAVAIIGWTKDRKIYFGYSRLNNLIEKIGLLEYTKMRLGIDLQESEYD